MKIINANIDPDTVVIEAVDVLRDGGVLIYPTDTLYGLGANARNREGVKRLREIKGRSRGLVFSVMFSDIEELVRYVHIDATYNPALKMLPGPYTFVFPSKKKLPDGVIGPGIGLGVRIPDHDLARRIAREFGGPIITTSVNRTGDPPLTEPSEIREVFGKEVDLFIDSGKIPGVASTIISFISRPPKVLRLGAGKIDFLSEIE